MFDAQGADNEHKAPFPSHILIENPTTPQQLQISMQVMHLGSTANNSYQGHEYNAQRAPICNQNLRYQASTDLFTLAAPTGNADSQLHDVCSKNPKEEAETDYMWAGRLQVESLRKEAGG